jgi:RimJ/RimL family protein N-acetyltransferase
MHAAIDIPDSARLRYRLMDVRNERDKKLLWELDQDPEVMRFLNDSKPTSWEEIESFIVPRVASFSDRASGRGLWEMADKHSGEHLGWILVRHYRFDKPNREPDNIELGWRLKRSHWNKGITTEGARAIMNVLQQNPGIRVFSALADPANLASTSVMKKLGMRFIDDRVHIVDEARRYPAAYYEMPSPNFNGRLPA